MNAESEPDSRGGNARIIASVWYFVGTQPRRSLSLLFACLCLAGCTSDTPNLEAEWASHPFLRAQMLTITSREQKPVTVQSIAINGEFTVDTITTGSGDQPFEKRTLTVGETTTYWVHYAKRILHAEIKTDRGTCRIEFEKVSQ